VVYHRDIAMDCATNGRYSTSMIFRFILSITCAILLGLGLIAIENIIFPKAGLIHQRSVYISECLHPMGGGLVSSLTHLSRRTLQLELSSATSMRFRCVSFNISFIRQIPC
jgi:hypothetical protein